MDKLGKNSLAIFNTWGTEGMSNRAASNDNTDGENHIPEVGVIQNNEPDQSCFEGTFPN